MKEKSNLIITIFGSTGDLVAKKVLPAISELIEKEKLHKNIKVIAVGRKSFDALSYLEFISRQNNSFNWENLKDVLAYVEMDILNSHDYLLLKNALNDFSSSKTKFVHFFALSPDLVLNVSENMFNAEIFNKSKTNHRVIFEKPFGESYKSTKKLNKELWKYFTEEQIYRIDHYLGKDVVKTIYSTRFENQKVEEFLKTRSLAYVRILALEKDGVLKRGAYYDNFGASKDMFQSHLLQLVALSMMKKPSCDACDEMLDNKVKFIKSLTFNKNALFFGQYDGYLKELNVSSKSKTDTLFFAEMHSKFNEYKNIPIYFLTGKRLSKKQTIVELGFKNDDKLVFNIDPESSVELHVSGKKKIVYKSKKELSPYASLLKDAWQANKKYFVRFDEIESSWKVADKILKNKQELVVYNDELEVDKYLNDFFDLSLFEENF